MKHQHFMLPLYGTLSAQSANYIGIFLIASGIILLVVIVTLYLLYRSPARWIRMDLEKKLEELTKFLEESQQRVRELDTLIIDHLKVLSSAGSHSFTMLKQILGALERRLVEVTELMQSKEPGSLEKAQELLEKAIDNTGDQVTSILEPEAVLTLKPEQFLEATSNMFTIVEKDLQQPPTEAEPHPHHRNRKRQFTIDGFFKALKGDSSPRQ